MDQEEEGKQHEEERGNDEEVGLRKSGKVTFYVFLSCSKYILMEGY